MKVSTYHTVRLTYNWKNIQKKKDGIKWSPEILLVTAVLLKWPTEIDLGLWAGRGGVCMCVIFFFISKPSWCCEYMRDVWQTRTWFVELWKANIVSFGHFFFGSRSLLPTDVCSLSYDKMERKKNSRKSFGLFPFSLCSRSPHANDGFQFAFAGEKMAFPMRRLGSYDGMWHAIQRSSLHSGAECLLSLDVGDGQRDDLLDMRLLWLLGIGIEPRVGIPPTYLGFRLNWRLKFALCEVVRSCCSR